MAEQAQAPDFIRTVGEVISGDNNGIPTQWRKPTMALPIEPVDGQEIYFLADEPNGVIWHLKYRQGSASAYKWEFVGGASLFSEAAASDSLTSSSYAALPAAGPSVPSLTLPLAGDYSIELGCLAYNTTSGDGADMSYDIGGTPASAGDNIQIGEAVGVNTGFCNLARRKRKNGLAVVTLTAKYRRLTGGTAFFQDRWMRATPIRVG